MNRIHLFGGEKGGVGKSFVARAAVEFHLDRELPFSLFDTDRSNPTVLKIYGSTIGCQTAVFSEGEKYEDAPNLIFNAAEEKTVLVNLPAQSFIPLREWIENNELLDLGQEAGIQFVHWFISDCSADSLALLSRILRQFKTSVTHVLARNLGMTDTWAQLDQDKNLQAAIANYKVKVIEFPKFMGNAERRQMEVERIPFHQALDHQDFKLISRQRVKTFLRKAYAAFDEAEVFGG